MKKGIKTGLTLLLLCSMVFTACGKKENTDTNNVKDETSNTTAENTESATTAPEKAAAEDPLKVVYLVNGNLGDKGFFDSAASGIEKIGTELGGEVKVVEMGRNETSYEGHFLDVSEQDWDIIIAGTWSVKEITEQTAASYPDKKYIAFDCGISRDVVTEGNIMGISYKAYEGAYLAGVLAAQMLDSGDVKIDANKRTLGFVGSMDMAGINDFLVGYLEGVKSVDPEIQVLTSYVGAFEDVPKCLEMTTQLYNQGAQIIYAPASQSIIGAATAASNVDKYLIACDQDLYTQLIDEQPEIAKNVLTSTLKNVGESLFTAVQAAQNNEMSFDEDYTLGLESGAIGLAENENFKKIVPQDIIDNLSTIKDKIISGEIAVSSALTMTTEEVAALRDSMK